MNKNCYVLLANGFEEIEALATVDMLRRAGMEVVTVSINEGVQVVGAHGVTVCADTTIEMIDAADAGWLILPGGLPGATNLAACQRVVDMLHAQDNRGGNIAAICASPAMVLAPIGLLSGHTATCYPGCEVDGEQFTGADVEVSGNIVTGKGPGLTMKFALAIIEKTLGEAKAREVAAGMLLV